MKTILKIILFILSISSVSAKNIYVSKTGNDNNAGTQAAPYLTISKAASVAVAGDVVFIRQGTYQEVLRPVNSGSVGKPIIFQSYPGEQVILSAMKALSGWTKTTGSIYKTTVPFTVLGEQNFVMNDNTALTLARWPNKTSEDPFILNTIRNTGGSTKYVSTGAFLTESSIPNINWTGGAVFFYGDKAGSGWTAWKKNITSSSSGKVNFNLTFNANEEWVRTYHAPADLGDFYLEGVKEALDYQNEWYYDESTKELFVQLPNGAVPVDGQIKMRSSIETINLKDRSYIQIKNLAVFGGTINMEDSSTWQTTNGNSRTTNNLLYGVTSLYGNHTQGISNSSRSSMASINLQGSNNVIEKCEVAFNSAAGIQARGNTIKIINNYIHDFDYLANYDAPLVIRGITNSIIKNNTIFNGGRDAIQYAGTNNEIAYNDVSHSNLLADDCALFYTVGKQLGTEIHHNWFHDTQSPGVKYKAAGIYLDNDAEGFKVHHNMVWNVEWTNIQINWNGKNIDVFNNTLCKAGKGTMGAWHKAGTAFSNVKVWNNITDKQAISAGGQETETTWEPQSDKQNNIVSKESFVNWTNNNFHLKANAPAVDYGRVITGYTDGFKGAKPDAGAYEIGDNWVAGINWDPKLSPNGLGCYGLPGEGCNEISNPIVESVDFSNAPDKLAINNTYTFNVNYAANEPRDVIVEIKSAANVWLGRARVSVAKGTGTTPVTINLANSLPSGVGYKLSVWLVPTGLDWQAIIVSNNKVFEVEPPLVEAVQLVNTPATVETGNTYTFDFSYTSAEPRDVILEVKNSANVWLGNVRVAIPKGTGTASGTINFVNNLQVGTGYKLNAMLVPTGLNWQAIIVSDNKLFDVEAPFSQLIANGSYTIESNSSNQRLLSRALENHETKMVNPGNYSDQEWIFNHLGNNIYTIKNKGTNRFLEVPFAKCENLVQVATYTSANSNHQKWRVVENGSGIYGLQPAHCLTQGLDRNNGTLDTNVLTYNYWTGNNNQKWRIIATGTTSKVKNALASTIDSNINIYPNPAKDFMIISGVLNTESVSIVDLSGRKVSVEKQKTENGIVINTSQLEAGVYVALIAIGNTTSSYKFIKE